MKDGLERSAPVLQGRPAGKMSELIDTHIPGYNFDMAEGVPYDLDLTKPFGQRYQNLKFKGQPVLAESCIRLCGGCSASHTVPIPISADLREDLRRKVTPRRVFVLGW